MRGVFFSRIYVADSRRDSVPTYFRKQGVTWFSWYQSQVYSKEDLIFTGNLKRAIVTLQYTYIIHMIILTPFGIDRPPFWNLSLESFIFVITSLILE